MEVRLHNPKRTVAVTGPLKARELCEHLGLNRESVLIIRADELVTWDAVLADTDAIEVRPVISGG